MELLACWYENGWWRGYVLAERTAHLRLDHTFATWLASLHGSFVGALQSVEFSVGAPVRLIAEPSNPVDPDAIAVWNTTHTLQAGYLPAHVVSGMAKLSTERHGLVIGEVRWELQRRGALILVSREPVTIRRDPAPDDRWLRRGERLADEGKAWYIDHQQAPPPMPDPAEEMFRMARDLQDRPPRGC